MRGHQSLLMVVVMATAVSCSSGPAANGSHAAVCGKLVHLNADYQMVLADSRVGTNAPDVVDAHVVKVINDVEQARVDTDSLDPMNRTLSYTIQDLRSLRRALAGGELITPLMTATQDVDELDASCSPGN